jgi:YVTN family beta-propeller protein
MTKVMMSWNGKIHWNALVFAFILLFAGLALPLNIAYAEQVVTIIPVGTEPMAVATNSNTNKIYVANTNGNDVSVIDGVTNNVISTILVGSGPHNIKVNPATNMIYVSNFGGGISVIDGKTDAVVFTISGINPNAIAVNPNTNLIYATVRSVGVYVINGSTNAIASKIPFNYNEDPIQPVVNPNTNMIYVPTICLYCHPSYVVVINGSTNTRVMNIPYGNSFGDADMNIITNMIYVSDVANNYQIDVINGSSNRIVSNIPMTSYVTGVGVNPNTNLIYVASGADNSTYVINGTNNNIVEKIPAGYNPAGVAVNPNTHVIYVTNAADNTVSVIGDSAPYPHFSISSSPDNLNIPPGSSGNFTITISSFMGFSGTISLSATTPSGFTSNLCSSSVTVPSGGTASSILTVSIPPAASTGNNYAVTVTATNGSLTSSTALKVTTFTYPPSTPTNLISTAISSSQINLSWNAPVSNGTSPLIGYEIERSVSGDAFSVLVLNTGNTGTTYSDTGLSPNTTYVYRVSAINSVGTGDSSNTASATTPLLSVAGNNIGPITPSSHS